jgi:hypothetical protein
VLETFDGLLDATSPLDCSIEYQAESERRQVGWRGGWPFETALPAGPEKLDQKLLAAAEILIQAQPDAWTSCNSLLELASAWTGAAEETRAGKGEEYLRIASGLWRAAFRAVEEGVRRKYEAGVPDPTGETETLSEVALEQLRQAARTCGVEFEEFEDRYRTILKRAAQVRERG